MNKPAVVGLCSFLLVLAAAGVASAQTADAVVERYLSAVGGREALGKLASRKSTGRVTLSTPGGDISGPIEILLKSPNKNRAFMTLDLSAMGAGALTVEQRFDGTVGYSLNSLQGNSEITGNQLANMRNNTFPIPLLAYKEAGITVAMQSNERIGGKDTTVVLVTPRAGSAMRMFFDTETHLLVRTIATIETPQTGPIEQTSDFSDYRTVDGVKVAFRVVNTNPLQTLTIALTSVEHNVAIDDAVFGKP